MTFGVPGLVAPDLLTAPRVHRRADQAFEGGGSLKFVTGDLTHRDVCPGPFDVVVERRTVQLFQGDEQAEALDCLVARLGSPATLVSQEHSGWWKPHEPRTHFAEDWCRARGFALDSVGDLMRNEAAPRLAILRFTSG